MDRNSFLIGLFVGLVIYFMFTKLSSPKVSEYTIQPFDGMTDLAAVKDSLKTQVSAVATELAAELSKAKTENKTINERIAISNTYNDQLCQLNKGFAEWILRHGG